MYTYAVFANSSAILKDGWVIFLKEDFVNYIMNFSLGESSTPANLYQLLANFDKLNCVDCILIAPTINWKLGVATYGANNLVIYIKAFLRKACSFGVPVVCVDQPQPDNLLKLALGSDIW